MKTIITAAAALFAANISASDFYHGLEEGNSDLYTAPVSAADFTGVQPSIGDSADRYHGLADGNSDLFKTDRGSRTESTEDPDIYRGLGGNPDLRF